MNTTQEDLEVSETIQLRKENPLAERLFSQIESMANSLYQARRDMDRAEKNYQTSLKIVRKFLEENN